MRRVTKVNIKAMYMMSFKGPSNNCLLVSCIRTREHNAAFTLIYILIVYILLVNKVIQGFKN